ncbi:type IV toxin-antitoxin system AbiEi family antitoxin domain-containing protein [Duganella violaceipulchra]|uniref:Transcriptional regulator of viral defense system n=1 Tax=Duganella violaceipulchra TaxID=2849652 RepID=A0AA41HED6_9BURK|nr:hypothetical protein [Duganella violaceicalia]MBV6325141.1 hypothetical protein [Duganella violaceicalia]MCP2011567.1 putative transcriptional regulator of viral defense system [Duganella violaceicalia]
MEKQLSVVAALTQWLLKEHRSPVVSLYDIGVATMKIYQTREYGGQKIKNIRTTIPRRESVFSSRKELLDLGIIEEKRELPNGCFLSASSSFQEGMDLACGIDPFCYVSHLSAMEHHGLTDRFSKTTFITTVPAQQWKVRAQDKMKRDLGEDLFLTYIEAGFPALSKHIITSLNRSPVSVLSTKFADQGSYVNLSDRPVRISSIGRTFIDMLRKPDLCGGMRHVIDVYKEHALSYLPLITSEVDRNGDKIEKVRAGYILEELCKIENNSTINGWIAFAQRGGSRVLDPSEEYWSTFSEKWCLSINVPGISDE